MGAVGAENVFNAVKGRWAGVSWGTVIAANPDVIVIVIVPSSESTPRRPAAPT